MTSPVRRIAAATLSTALLGLSIASLVGTAEAAPAPKSYKTCAALNKVYKHGVARTLPKLDSKGKVVKKNGKVVYVKALDKVGKTTKPVTTFATSSAVYDRNNGVNSKAFKDGVKPKAYKGEIDLDRDNDGIACEKK